MAPSGSTDWWSIGTTLGTFLAALVIAFVGLYRKARHDTGEDIVQKSVGAAFVDAGVASDMRRVAENTDKMVDIMENRETRWKEAELLKKLEEKLKHDGH